MDAITEFLVEDAYIIVVVLWVLGFVIKNTPKIMDWIIPYILLIVGVIGTVSLMGFTPDAVFQGVIVTGIAVYGHQLVKQVTERE